jgi:hypothetical protein
MDDDNLINHPLIILFSRPVAVLVLFSHQIEILSSEYLHCRLTLYCSSPFKASPPKINNRSQDLLSCGHQQSLPYGAWLILRDN